MSRTSCKATIRQLLGLKFPRKNRHRTGGDIEALPVPGEKLEHLLRAGAVQPGQEKAARTPWSSQQQ